MPVHGCTRMHKCTDIRTCILHIYPRAHTCITRVHGYTHVQIFHTYSRSTPIYMAGRMRMPVPHISTCTHNHMWHVCLQVHTCAVDYSWLHTCPCTHKHALLDLGSTPCLLSPTPTLPMTLVLTGGPSTPQYCRGGVACPGLGAGTGWGQGLLRRRACAGWGCGRAPLILPEAHLWSCRGLHRALGRAPWETHLPHPQQWAGCPCACYHPTPFPPSCRAFGPSQQCPP